MRLLICRAAPLIYAHAMAPRTRARLTMSARSRLPRVDYAIVAADADPMMSLTDNDIVRYAAPCYAEDIIYEADIDV